MPLPDRDRVFTIRHTVAADTMHVHSRDHRELLAAVVEGVEEGLVVCDRDGDVLCRNSRARRILERDRQPRALHELLADLTRTLAGWTRTHGAAAAHRTAGAGALLHSTQVGVRVGAHAYRVRGAVVRSASPRHRTLIVLSLSERGRGSLMSPDEMRERYGLTPTQIRVATLLAAGARARDIAAALDVQLNTARRHSEAVLQKLSVHSRAAVRARLQSD